MFKVISIAPNYSESGRQVQTLTMDLKTHGEAIRAFNSMCKHRGSIVTMFKDNELVKQSNRLVSL